MRTPAFLALLLLPSGCDFLIPKEVAIRDSSADTSPPPDTGYVAPTSCDGWSDEWAAQEQDVLDLVNAVRAEGYRCYDGFKDAAPPLVMEERLRCAARLHSQDMGEHNWFSHSGSDGSSMQSRVEAQGYVDWTSLGENIAAGASDPGATVDMWLGSTEGHCSNIMSSGFTELGVGVFRAPHSSYEWFWTQDFGDR